MIDQIPTKPKERTEIEYQQSIRKELGYDNINIFTDEEGNELGMKNLMGLKNEVEIEAELSQRRDKYDYYLKMAKSKYDRAMDKYNKFKIDHPELFKSKPQVSDKKRK